MPALFFDVEPKPRDSRLLGKRLTDEKFSISYDIITTLASLR